MKKYNYEAGFFSSFALKRYLSSISHYQFCITYLIMPSILLKMDKRKHIPMKNNLKIVFHRLNKLLNSY